MKAVKSLTSATILNVVKKILRPGARFFTNGLLAYEVLHKEGFNYNLTVVSQDVHKFISNAKGLILGTYHGLGQKHLQAYLDEFCYRTNRRNWPKQLSFRLLEACICARTVTKQELASAEQSD